ncbi:Noc2p family-domain-containing protein [Gaertneriomyces semiglobifer]|nr:Noc2p family-domain-containing protein [Gaertneriomyces semiglobifer]
MAKAKKATKKFIKNHLKDTIQRRKKHQKATKHFKLKPKKDDPVEDVVDSDTDGMDDSGDEESDVGFGAEGVDGLSSDDDSDDGGSDSDELEDMSDLSGDEEEDLEDLEDLPDEDDDEEVDATSSSTKKEALNKQIEEHKAELENLKEKDPEFFKFLAEHDKDLLDFVNEEVSDDEEEDELHGSGDEHEEEEEGQGEFADDNDTMDNTGTQIPITKPLLLQWRTSLTTLHSLRTLRKCLLAFRAAALSVSPSENATADTSRYTIPSPSIFNSLLLLVIRHAPLVFNHHLGWSEEKKGIPSQTTKWKRVQILVKSYLSNLVRLMTALTDTTLLSFLVRESSSSGIYFACFPKLSKDYLKCLLTIWSSDTAESDGEKEKLRIVSFLAIRKLCIVAPTSFLDMAMKSSMKTFLQLSRNTTVYTWPSLNFMMNCCVELCGVHIPTTYQHLFIALRQSATLLRTAIVAKTKESVKKVMSWSYLQNLRLIGRILATYCERNSPLRESGGSTLEPLIYPLVQISLGAMRLRPGVRCLPYRFQVLKTLHGLQAQTGVYIPTTPFILEVLDSNVFSKKSKPSTLKPLDFSMSIKTPKGYEGTRVFTTGVVEEIVQALYDAYEPWSTDIAFPELSVPVVVQLRRFVKRERNVGREVMGVAEKFEENAKWISQKRQNVEFSPRDTRAVEQFLSEDEKKMSPLFKYCETRKKIKDKEMERRVKEQEAERERVAVKSGKKEKAVSKEDEGDDDEVGDFELSDLSDVEGEEYEMESEGEEMEE